MGRKSRGKHTVKAPAISAYSNKKEVDRLVQKLLNSCVKPTTRKDEWENYLEIQFLVERIRQYQSSAKPSSGDRMEKLSAFKDWLEENGTTLNDVTMEEYGGEYGIGLRATSDIKMEDEIIQVPYSIMMTSEKAGESYLDDLIKSRKMLSEMPNVSLALYLHCEKFNSESFYRPYIDILPSEYNLPLYFSMKEMEFLEGSVALSVALSHYKSIARQYGIFFNLLHSDTVSAEVEKISQAARNEFTYDAYRWAVSTVSTRLNRIATMTREEEHEMCQHSGSCHNHKVNDSTLALIPLWDMMNHSHGQISTDCDPKLKFCISYAMRDFKSGEQVTIFYGARSNAGFLVYNGFIVEDNPYDQIEIQLGVSPNDKLYKKRIHLLEKLRIKPSGSFHIYAITENLPTSPDLLAFLRVFLMNEVEIDSWYSKELYGNGGLKEIYIPNMNPSELDKKVWKFLENRVDLLLRGYKRTDKEEEEILADLEMSQKAKLAIKLHRETKKVLAACRDFCHDFPLNPESYVNTINANLKMAAHAHRATASTHTPLEGGGERDTEVDIAILSAAAAGMQQNGTPEPSTEENGVNDENRLDSATAETQQNGMAEPSTEEAKEKNKLDSATVDI